MKLLAIILSVLPAILAGDYTAKTLSVAEQDSILNADQVVEDDYTVCTRYRLESENEDKIFRHSSVADWFVYDTMRHTRKQLGEGLQLGKVRDAEMSPNGRYVAFAKDNNLYVHKLDFGTEVAVTTSINTDIISGIADWLYEEEFGTTALFAWSPDSRLLAYVRLDETEVPTFSWEVYSDTQYPILESLRYPKAGCKNAKASVNVYDLTTKRIVTMQLPNMDDCYIPRLRWTNSGELLVLRVNRDQTKMEVFSCNARSTVAVLLYKEESKDYYMDYSLFDEWLWLSDDSFVALSEKNGWRRAYLHSSQGLMQRVLTPDSIDVTALYAVDEKNQVLFYQAAPTPSTRQVYAIGLKEQRAKNKEQILAPVQLTEGEGIHRARFSNDQKKMIECFQSFEQPNTYTLYNVDGKKMKVERLRVLEENKEVREAWQANQLPEPELLNINGLEAMLMLPNEGVKELMNEGKRPLVVMHYSGPASQRVLNRWRKKFEYALVEAGYAVLIVDPRGSDCKGRAWRNETYMNLGMKEAEDLIAAAQWASRRDDIDSTRMALLGWSYGGYQTLMTMSQKAHPFKAGVAIAPVTDWKLYDTGYTERFMRRPQVNDKGYKNASLLPRAADLTGHMLIIHGTADDNVHAQQTWQYIDALVRADKQFEMQIYPDDNHHLRRGNNASHMHNRILEFLGRNLK